MTATIGDPTSDLSWLVGTAITKVPKLQNVSSAIDLLPTSGTVCFLLHLVELHLLLTDFGNTDDAKKGVVEQLEDICGGQTHRLKVKDQLLAEAAVLGRELSIEDTYDDRRRRHGIFPSRVSRGGAQATANDRGHFGGGRGGGNAGRGPGRVVPPAASR